MNAELHLYPSGRTRQLEMEAIAYLESSLSSKRHVAGFAASPEFAEAVAGPVRMIEYAFQ